MMLKVWQYRVKTEKGCWLADVLLREDGFFSTVSDWGNYAFRWTRPGMEFRAFVAQLAGQDEYVCGKLARRDWYDGEGTLRRIRERILTERREKSISNMRARKEWDLLKEVLSLYGIGEDMRSVKEIDLPTFFRWHDQTDLSNASEMCRYDFHPDVRSFCREVMPPLAAMLRAELAAEGSQPTPPRDAALHVAADLG